MKTEPNDSAFAVPAVYGNGELDIRHESPEFGLTKREYFAAKIMAGFAASTESTHDDTFVVLPNEQATDAVRWADALIAALNEKHE